MAERAHRAVGADARRATFEREGLARGLFKCEKCAGLASYKCGGCERAWFCGQACQRAAWKQQQHKRLCPLLASAPSAEGVIRVLAPHARGGDVHAMWKLAKDLRTGALGVVNDTLSLAYLNRAAMLGDAEAQFSMGLKSYNDGDAPSARRWYAAAAEQGLDKAQCNLGQLLCAGLGGPRDEAAGMQWFRRAANSGHASALRACQARGIEI